MKVKCNIIELAKNNNKVKARLCYDFDVSAQTVARWLDNPPNGELTKHKAVLILAEELNIPFETILTNEP